MHILTDENGNPIAHGHDHDHHASCDASKEHCGSAPECGSCPSHGAGEGHEHGGGHHHHEHGLPKPQTPEQMTAVLDYMHKHNLHHAGELDALADTLTQMGKAECAQQLKKAVDEFSKGNLYLGLALSMLKGE